MIRLRNHVYIEITIGRLKQQYWIENGITYFKHNVIISEITVYFLYSQLFNIARVLRDMSNSREEKNTEKRVRAWSRIIYSHKNLVRVLYLIRQRHCYFRIHLSSI